MEGRNKINKCYLFKTGLHRISKVDTFQIRQYMNSYLQIILQRPNWFLNKMLKKYRPSGCLDVFCEFISANIVVVILLKHGTNDIFSF